MPGFSVALGTRTESSSEEQMVEEKLLLYQQSAVSDGAPAVADYLPDQTVGRGSAEVTCLPLSTSINVALTRDVGAHLFSRVSTLPRLVHPND